MRKVVLILMIGLLATAMVCAQGGAEKPAPVEQKQETLSGTLTIWSYLSQKSRATELENLARGFDGQPRSESGDCHCSLVRSSR
jgi:ABC-type glycerol-3-phosphate transport system substrate-binding protein